MPMNVMSSTNRETEGNSLEIIKWSVIGKIKLNGVGLAA